MKSTGAMSTVLVRAPATMKGNAWQRLLHTAMHDRTAWMCGLPASSTPSVCSDLFYFSLNQTPVVCSRGKKEEIKDEFCPNIDSIGPGHCFKKQKHTS